MSAYFCPKSYARLISDDSGDYCSRPHEARDEAKETTEKKHDTKKRSKRIEAREIKAPRAQR